MYLMHWTHSCVRRVQRGLKFFVRSRPAGIWEIFPPPALQTSNPHRPRTFSVPNWNLSLCVWEPLKPHAVCFIACGKLFRFKGNRNTAVKSKKCAKPLSQPSLLLSQITVRKTLQFCSSAICDIPPAMLNTHSLAELVAITQDVFLARTLRSPNRGFATTGECLYTLVPQAPCNIELLAHHFHMRWVTRTKNFLPRSARIALRVPTPPPAQDSVDFHMNYSCITDLALRWLSFDCLNWKDRCQNQSFGYFLFVAVW